MDVTGPQYFTAIAQAGSITGAAKQLGVSQPAISNWLNNMESTLGVQLVIRSRRSLVLTPAGRIYLEGAKKMIEIRNETYRAISAINGVQSSVIRVAGSPNGGAVLFAEIFQDFQARFPAVNLQFIEAYNRPSMQMVESGKVDFGIVSSLDMGNPNLSYILNGTSELVLMVPYGFPTAYNAEHLKKTDPFPAADFSQLQGLPFIMPDDAMSYTDALNSFFDGIGYTPNVIFRSGNVQIIHNMVRSGNGIAVLPRRLFSPIDSVSPFSLEPQLINHSTLVYKKGKRMTEAEEYLLTLLHHRPKADWVIYNP